MIIGQPHTSFWSGGDEGGGGSSFRESGPCEDARGASRRPPPPFCQRGEGVESDAATGTADAATDTGMLALRFARVRYTLFRSPSVGNGNLGEKVHMLFSRRFQASTFSPPREWDWPPALMPQGWVRVPAIASEDDATSISTGAGARAQPWGSNGLRKSGLPFASAPLPLGSWPASRSTLDHAARAQQPRHSYTGGEPPVTLIISPSRGASGDATLLHRVAIRYQG